MKEFTYTIEDPNGLHARPAGMLATFAKRFQSDIRIKVGDKEADAKRLLALMSLGAVHGTNLTVSVSGEDEEVAAQELEAYLGEKMQNGKKRAEGTASNET
ncbi:MAG: HPr family phosphocarrier protein [Clostridia bacterium]|nr:HPr family phosphocarrier protein [Clostridia bacterium]